MRLTKLFLATLSLFPLAAMAEDWGTWFDVAVEKKLSAFTLSLNGGYRFERPFDYNARRSLGVALDYKCLPPLKMGIGYQYLDRKRPTVAQPKYDSDGQLKGYNLDLSEWRDVHRFTFQLTGKQSFGRFTFSLRERYQCDWVGACDVVRKKYRAGSPTTTATDSYEGYILSSTDIQHKSHRVDHRLRTRFQVAYNIRHCKVTPYLSYELYSDLRRALATDKHRYTLGATWKINKSHALQLEYIRQRQLDRDEGDPRYSQAIATGYTFQF